MTDMDIKIMISNEILNAMGDQSAADVLRNILFFQGNTINWKKAYDAALKHMPELKKDYS